MQFFANLKTKAKIFIGFLVVIVINMIIVISAITALNTSRQAAVLIDDTLDHAFQRVNSLQGAIQTIPANLSNRGKSFDLNAVQPKDSHDFLKHGLVAG